MKTLQKSYSCLRKNDFIDVCLVWIVYSAPAHVYFESGVESTLSLCNTLRNRSRLLLLDTYRSCYSYMNYVYGFHVSFRSVCLSLASLAVVLVIVSVRVCADKYVAGRGRYSKYVLIVLISYEGPQFCNK